MLCPCGQGLLGLFGMPFKCFSNVFSGEGRLESPGEEGTLAAGPWVGWEETQRAPTPVVHAAHGDRQLAPGSGSGGLGLLGQSSASSLR